jgi:hypothetical protein
LIAVEYSCRRRNQYGRNSALSISAGAKKSPIRLAPIMTTNRIIAPDASNIRISPVSAILIREPLPAGKDPS